MATLSRLLIGIWIIGFITVSASAQQQSRIINGKPASTATYPWLTSIFVLSAPDAEGGGGCGGSLIAPTWVLTAAHCFLDESGKQVGTDLHTLTTLTLNSDNNSDLSANAIVRKAIRVIIHPDYNPSEESSNSHDFDIALVELESAVNLPLVKLYTGAMTASIPAIVAGWGATVGDGTAASDNLLATQLMTVTASACQGAHGELITSNMFCAGGYTSTDTSDTCQGDSGGPIFVRLNQGTLQLGITSFGGSDSAGCGTPGSPGVYANIAELFSFISSHATGFTTVNSLGDIRTISNAYDGVTDSVTLPKVYADGDNYSVTLKHTGNFNFVLASGEMNTSNDMDAVPSFFDAANNLLLLPLVKVGSETFHVALRHLGDFKFVLETADPID